jgi:hypothetical protein
MLLSLSILPVEGNSTMKKLWTPKQQRILDDIEAKRIEAGAPEHQARMMAEQELEKRIERRSGRRTK